MTIVGGKLTTFRQLAEDAVADLNKRLKRGKRKSLTRNRKLPGAHFKDLDSLISELHNLGASDRIANRLARIYGSRSLEIWSIIELDESASELIDSSIGLTKAEIEYVLVEEFPKTLTDLMARRLILAFEKGHGLDAIEKIAKIAAGKLGWNINEAARQIEGYKAWLNHLAIPDETGPRSTHFGAKQMSESR